MKNNSTADNLKRCSFEGTLNIVKFNYPLLLVALLVIICSLGLSRLLPQPTKLIFIFIAFITTATTLLSLVVSWWVYDHSNYYSLDWMDGLVDQSPGTALNIHAGFDETSALLQRKFPQLELSVADFYDPTRHTEPSIRRARQARVTYPGTKTVRTHQLNLVPRSLNVIFLLLSVHEIREGAERVLFLKQLVEALSSNGRIVVVEHLRDFGNFIAYNIGAFHFHSRAEFLANFTEAKLSIEKEFRITPFLRVFLLKTV